MEEQNDWRLTKEELLKAITELKPKDTWPKYIIPYRTNEQGRAEVSTGNGWDEWDERPVGEVTIHELKEL